MGLEKFPQLKKDPVIESIFEIRFIPQLEIEEVTIGAIVGGLSKAGFQRSKELPAKAVPFATRQADPNLKYQGTIQIFSTKYSNLSAKIGPFSLLISCHDPYLRWENFSKAINDCIDSLLSTFPIKQIERLGLRYINVLTGQTSILDSTNCKFDVPVVGTPRQQLIRSEIQSGKFLININVGAAIQGQLIRNDGSKMNLEGILIDIDVAQQGSFNATDIRAWLETAHDAEKEAFFNIVKDAALKDYK